MYCVVLYTGIWAETRSTSGGTGDSRSLSTIHQFWPAASRVFQSSAG